MTKSAEPIGGDGTSHPARSALALGLRRARRRRATGAPRPRSRRRRGTAPLLEPAGAHLEIGAHGRRPRSSRLEPGAGGRHGSGPFGVSASSASSAGQRRASSSATAFLRAAQSLGELADVGSTSVRPRRVRLRWSSPRRSHGLGQASAARTRARRGPGSLPASSACGGQRRAAHRCRAGGAAGFGGRPSASTSGLVERAPVAPEPRHRRASRPAEAVAGLVTNDASGFWAGAPRPRCASRRRPRPRPRAARRAAARCRRPRLRWLHAHGHGRGHAGRRRRAVRERSGGIPERENGIRGGCPLRAPPMTAGRFDRRPRRRHRVPRPAAASKASSQPGVDLDEVEQGAEHAVETGEALGAGRWPGLVERHGRAPRPAPPMPSACRLGSRASVLGRCQRLSRRTRGRRPRQRLGL